MAYDDDIDGDLPDLSNREVVRILMQEIADVRLELKTDIDRKIDMVDRKIDKVDRKIEILASDLRTLRLEVHQNQRTFMSNHDALEKRVTVLEAAA